MALRPDGTRYKVGGVLAVAKEKCTFLPFYLEPELEPIKTECILSTPITEMNFNGVVKTTVLPVYSHI